MDTRTPVIICRTSVIPRRNPMFHKNEMEEGDGRSIKEVLIMLPRGCFFIS